MGQKINPYGFRLGVSTDWKSRWFSDREYKQYLTEDWQIRDSVMERLERPHLDRSATETRHTTNGGGSNVGAGTPSDKAQPTER